VAPESSRYKQKVIAEFPHVKAANSKSLGGVAVSGRVNIIKVLEAGGFLTITGIKVSYRELAA
jgi:hypothetical protein